MAVISIMAMRLRRQRFNGAHDVVVAGAAANVAGEVVPDFPPRRVRVFLEQLAHAHDHPRCAETALQSVMFMESRLDRMQGATTRCEAFDGRDRGSICHDRENRAGFDGLAVDIDGAGAALRRVATDMGSGEAEIVPQQMDQKFSRLDRSGLTDTLDLDGPHVMILFGIDP